MGRAARGLATISEEWLFYEHKILATQACAATKKKAVAGLRKIEPLLLAAKCAVESGSSGVILIDPEDIVAINAGGRH